MYHKRLVAYSLESFFYGATVFKFIKQNNNFARASHFFSCKFFPVFARLRGEFAFYGGRKEAILIN